LKITYILSKIDKAIAFEWITTALKKKHEFSFIFIGGEKGHLYSWLEEKEIPVYFIPYSGKFSIPTAFFQLSRLLIKLKSEIVHTHLFEANLLGLTAAKLLGIPKRIYTRHHSTFHHEFYPNAVKWDRWCNWIATDIVAITKSVKNVLIDKEQVNSNKISLIEHGFKLDDFAKVDVQKLAQLKNKYNIPEDKIIIGAISRYIEWKGTRYIINAFKTLFEKNSNLHLVLANASGPDKELVKKELSMLPKASFTEILFENDLFTLYGIFDVFVHCPINSKIEAFGQTYVESLAASVPSVFTLSGVANDFIINERNALIVDYMQADQIVSAVQKLTTDKELIKKIKINGLADVQAYSLEVMIHKLEILYN